MAIDVLVMVLVLLNFNTSNRLIKGIAFRND